MSFVDMPLCYIFVPKLSIGSGKMAKMEEKTNFSKKKLPENLWIQKIVVPLQRFRKQTGV